MSEQSSTFADLSRPLALLRMLAVDYPHLPAPHIHVNPIWPDAVELACHDGLGDFEAWRAALHIDPQCVQYHLQGNDTTIRLEVSVERADARIQLVGYGVNTALAVA